MVLSFTHWGQNLPAPEIHQIKRASTAQYAEMWEEGGIIMGKIQMIKDVDKGNPVISQLIGRVNVAKIKVRRPITKVPSIVSESGRIKISLRIRETKHLAFLKIVNECRSREQLRNTLKSMKSWKVVFKQQPAEDRILGNGWCGYVAMNKICREAELSTNSTQVGAGGSSKQSVTHAGALRVLETVRSIYESSTGLIRANWESLGSSHLKGREILLSVMDTLRNWEYRLVDSLELARWLNAKNIYGTCNKWKYSHWGEDPEDHDYCDLRDSPKSTGPRVGMVTDYREWAWSVRNIMLVGRDNHYYVRKGGLEEDFEIAFDSILERIVELIGGQLNLPASESVRKGDLTPTDMITTIEEEPETNELTAKEDITRGSTSCNPVSLEEELKKVGEQPHPSNGRGARMNGSFDILAEDSTDNFVLNANTKPDNQEDSIIRVKAAPNKRKSSHNKKEPTCDLEEDNSGCNNKLKVIFWNSNGWNRERCEKIAMETEKTDADIICLTDTRMNPVRDTQMKTYEKMMDRITGKKWKGRSVNIPGYSRGCLVGGSILLTSYNCSNVRSYGPI
jgi:hypothetical protein